MFLLLQLLLIIYLFIFTIYSWFEYRRDMRKVEAEEEIRNVFVRFLFAIIALVLSILVFIF
ncbi:hypothetical protein J416_14887 [Gracilibacillus halophilus YIM-C55.5]|uniref:Uncharacterized protein n=1 Tax=Gracilibacillus halophilus YIM-C55.5 TaxID=1308866 RepID=N4W645_9BACI|nr:hypothetical protein J416_14887 [Gracilibacillus halophilus YIM-C55.5]